MECFRSRDRKIFCGIVGASRPDPEIASIAEEVGSIVASAGLTIVCGGLGGVMEAAARGARQAGGDVIGILPGISVREANPFVTHPVATGMGQARNLIIVHTADFLVAIGGEAGTLSEVAFGLKLGKPVLSLRSWEIPGVIKLENVHALLDWLRVAGYTS